MKLSKNTYVKLFRSIAEWEWYTDANTVRVFLHLLIMASIKPYRYQGAEVPRGGCVISYPSLAEELKLSVKSVRTALSHLKKAEAVAVTSYSKFSVATVKNYDKFQGTAESGQASGQANGRQAAGEGQQNKKIKEDKEYKEYDIAAHTRRYVGRATPPQTDTPRSRARGKPLPTVAGRPPSFDIGSYNEMAFRRRPKIPVKGSEE